MSLLLSPMAKSGTIPFYNGVATQSLRFDDGSTAFLSRTPSSANNDYDVVPYIVKADNSILLGAPQLNFG